MTESLADLVRVEDLPQIRVNPKETPPEVTSARSLAARPKPS